MFARAWGRAVVGGVVLLLEGGCSVFSPMPLWELSKAGGAVIAAALPFGPNRASDTVYHYPAPFKDLCIEFNAEAQAADLLPALQLELREHWIESRIFEAGSSGAPCQVWLRYSASIQWAVPPFGSAYRSYVDRAALTLLAADGRVLASSRYELDGLWGVGKWSSTRSKMAPVVKALVTGFEN